MIFSKYIPQKFLNILEFPGGVAVKDLALSLLWFRFDPWTGTSAYCGCIQKKKQKQKTKLKTFFAHEQNQLLRLHRKKLIFK